MNLNVNKAYDKFSVDVHEYSDDPNIRVDFLTTSGPNTFDFVNIFFYGNNYTESVSINVGRNALKKFIELMEEVMKSYREKNSNLN